MDEREEMQAVSHRYRELTRDEPPAQLDAAILAQARRSLADRPAPLVAPAGRHGWAYPVAAAAVIVLAVAVTAQLQRGEQDAELAVAPAGGAQDQAASEAASAPENKPRRADAVAKRKVERPAAPSAAAPQASGEVAAGKANVVPFAKQAERPGPQAEPAPAAAGRDETRALARSAAVPPESPEKWLERIAKLRDEGRDDEADRQLAEFRRRYPGYRIAEETLRKVERRAR